MKIPASKPNPELDRLLAAVKNLPPMTPAQLREQRISFVYGNLAIDNPNINREDVERVHDEMYGKPKMTYEEEILAKYSTPGLRRNQLERKPVDGTPDERIKDESGEPKPDDKTS